MAGLWPAEAHPHGAASGPGARMENHNYFIPRKKHICSLISFGEFSNSQAWQRGLSLVFLPQELYIAGGPTACCKPQQKNHILATGFVSLVKPCCLPASLVHGPGVAGEQAGSRAGSSSCGVGEADC